MEPIVLVRPVLPALEQLSGRLHEVLRSGVLTNDGAQVQAYEALLSAKVGIPDLAVCGSGTTAIQLACGALDLTGEVIVPAAAFPAVSQAVRPAGGTPGAGGHRPTVPYPGSRATPAAGTLPAPGVPAVH